MKKTFFDLLPPASVAVVVLFWAMVPTWFVEKPWSLVLVSSVMAVFVQFLELIRERHVGWRINKRELFTDIFYVIFGATVIQWLTTKLADDPLAAVKHSLGIETQWAMHLPFLLQVMLVVLLIEFGQYWMHRAMHNSFLWWTHAPHHNITQMNAMKGAVGNPIELFLITLSVVALFDVPETAVFCAAGIQTLLGCCTHSNVRFDSPRWYTFIFNTIEAHSLHHSYTPRYEDTRCNYGGTLIIFDRMFGTYRQGESEIVGQDERKRLTIWEQFIYPFREFMAMIKARKGASVSVSS